MIVIYEEGFLFQNETVILIFGYFAKISHFLAKMADFGTKQRNMSFWSPLYLMIVCILPVNNKINRSCDFSTTFCDDQCFIFGQKVIFRGLAEISLKIG